MWLHQMAKEISYINYFKMCVINQSKITDKVSHVIN